jgi:hypothetical protein
MTCPTEGQLNDYVAGRLSTRERWELGQHLESCLQCRDQVAELRDSGQWLDLLGATDAADHHVKPEAMAALADGTLEAGARAQVLAHVGECAECATVLGALYRGTAAVAPEQRVAAAAMAAPPTPQRRRSTSWAALAAAAAVVVVGAVLLTQFAKHGSQRPASPAAITVRAPVGDTRDTVAMPPAPDALVQATTGTPLPTAGAAQPPSLTARGSRAAPGAPSAPNRARRAGSMNGRALAYAPKSAASEAMGLADASRSRAGVPPLPPGGEPVELRAAEYAGGGTAGMSGPAGATGPAGPATAPDARDGAVSARSAPVPGMPGTGGGASPPKAGRPGTPGMPGRGGAGMPATTPPTPGMLGMPPTGAGRRPEGMTAKGGFANNQVMRMPTANQVQVQRREPAPRGARPADVVATGAAGALSQQSSVRPQPLRNKKAQVKPPQP